MQDYVMDGSKMIPSEELKAGCEKQNRAKGSEVERLEADEKREVEQALRGKGE